MRSIVSETGNVVKRPLAKERLVTKRVGTKRARSLATKTRTRTRSERVNHEANPVALGVDWILSTNWMPPVFMALAVSLNLLSRVLLFLV